VAKEQPTNEQALQGGRETLPPSNSRRGAEFVHGEDGDWQSFTPAIKEGTTNEGANAHE